MLERRTRLLSDHNKAEGNERTTPLYRDSNDNMIDQESITIRQWWVDRQIHR